MQLVARSSTCHQSGRNAASWRQRRHSCTAFPAVPASVAPYPAWLVAGQIPRCHWNDKKKLLIYLREGRPVVITGGCPILSGVVGKWDYDYLANELCSKEGGGHAVHMAPRTVRSHSRFYGNGLGKGGVRRMSWDAFVRQSRENEAREAPPFRYYLQTALIWSPTTKGGAYNSESGGSLSTGAGELMHTRVGPALADDLRQRVDWDWLASALETAESTGIHSMTMWAGMGGGATPMHFDAMSNFFTQLVGRKRILVFPPSQSYSIYPHPCAHLKDTYSMVDVEDPELSRFPALARARGLEVTLEAGDCLWLPSFYWHYVRQCDEGMPNLSVNCWCGAKPDGSTILGGRAKAYRGEAQTTIEKPTATDVLSCSCASAAASAKAARASPAAVVRMETKDDELLGGSSRSGVWAEDTHSVSGLRALVTGRWLETEAAKRIADAGLACSVGQLLNAMADGEDALSEEQAAAELGAHGYGVGSALTRRLPNSAVGPLGSPGHTVATRLRIDLVAEMGIERACALLRVVTRHGRLHPGLAPRIDGPLVNSEACQYTSNEEWRRMLESDGQAPSPFL